jgi:hypothetical protein
MNKSEQVPKPKVLLLGDSQRGRYQDCVKQMLADRAEVVAPGENGRFSLYTSMRLPIWLKDRIFGIVGITSSMYHFTQTRKH